MTTRRLHADSEVLAEIARDEDLLDAVIDAVERGAIEIVTTPAHAEELEMASGDMACDALAGLERLPTSVAPTGAHRAGPVTVLTDDPPAGAGAWTLDDLRRHLRGRPDVPGGGGPAVDEHEERP